MLALLLQQQPKEHCHGSRKETHRGAPIYMCHMPEDVLPC